MFGKFKEFKALVENLSERKIKTLALDNGGEYTSNEFGKFCKDVRIRGNLPLPIIHNRMVLLKGKTAPLWK